MAARTSPSSSRLTAAEKAAPRTGPAPKYVSYFPSQRGSSQDSFERLSRDPQGWRAKSILFAPLVIRAQTGFVSPRLHADLSRLSFLKKAPSCIEPSLS